MVVLPTGSAYENPGKLVARAQDWFEGLGTRVVEVPVGQALLGRVVDPLGQAQEVTRFLTGQSVPLRVHNSIYEVNRSFLELTGAAGAEELDERLHAERGRLHESELDDLRDGAFQLAVDRRNDLCQRRAQI